MLTDRVHRLRAHLCPHLVAVTCLTLIACSPAVEKSSDPAPPVALAGDWRAVLESPGGELPFTLRITESADGLGAIALNGDEEAPFSGVTVDGRTVVLDFSWYDSEITAELSEDGSQLTGRWRKTVPAGDSTLPFRATRGAGPSRFEPAGRGLEDGPAPDSIAGAWAVEFTDEDGTEPARGEFVEDGERLLGTFLTPTGDYRYLEGSYEDGRLRLSTFDGAHAFLFDAAKQPDGSLAGDFWSRDTYHATWTARPVESDERVLPDAWELVGLTNDQGRFRFEFPDLEGNPLSLADERFAGKVVLVNIFGSWCPNCNDKAPLLADWHRRYSERGLEIVGLAYEFSGDPERDREFVRRYAERHGIDFPLLLAGTSDKQAAAETLPDLTAVIAFPTTVFIGRDGTARSVHTGFAGPGTGDHYRELVADLEARIEALLAEPSGGSRSG